MPDNKLPKVEVTWLDAFDGPPGWVVAEEYQPQPVEVVSVGFFLKDYLEGHLSFCSSYFYDCSERLIISNPNHVPSGMALTVTYLDPKVVK